MRRIVITSQVFPPEIAPTAVMVEELAEYLSSNNWDVLVVCGYPHHPTGVLPRGWKKRLYSVEEREKYKVLRVWHFTSANKSMVVRTGVYLSQALAAAIGTLFSGKADVLLNYGPPLLGTGLNALVSKMLGAKSVNVIFDMYPDIAIEMGKIRNKCLITIAKLVEEFQYLATNKIVVLSEGFREQLVEKGVKREKIEVFHVWLDRDEITPCHKNNSWSRKIGIDANDFVVLYAGTIGLISGASILVEVAERLQAEERIRFLFVGEGQEKDNVVKLAGEKGLKNVLVLPFQERASLSAVLSTADVGIVTLIKGRGRTSVPSKVQGYMAAGLPVIASVDATSDTGVLIEEGGFGLRFDSGNIGHLADGILRISKDKSSLKRMGENARKAFLMNYEKEEILKQYEKSLADLTRKQL